MKLAENRAVRSALRRIRTTSSNFYCKLAVRAPRFPRELWIENTNHCNAKCVMCPRDKHSRPLGFMKLPLFERLMKEASRFAGSVERVHLHNYGEPLLDKDIVARVRIAKGYGMKGVYFVTNASLLTPQRSRDLIEAGLDEFKVSFYGTDRESYEGNMSGLEYDRTVENLREFFKLRAALKTGKPRIRIQYMLGLRGSGKEEFSAIFDGMMSREAGDCLDFSHLHNYGGGREYCRLGSSVRICGYPFRTMVILHDGSVVLCCVDYNGLQKVGDVNRDAIEEIWNGDAYRAVRRDFKRLNYGSYPACMRCNVIR